MTRRNKVATHLGRKFVRPRRNVRDLDALRELVHSFQTKRDLREDRIDLNGWHINVKGWIAMFG
jgi:hypothetical protein